MPRKAFLSYLIFFSVILSSCVSDRESDELDGSGSNSNSGEITVFAAASLTEAFNEMADAFELAHSGSVVVLNFSGSQQLALQLDQGASADLFASADFRNMDRMVDAGLVEAEGVTCFARNSLVVIMPADNPAEIRSLHDLARPGVKLILAGETVPIGVYTRRVLTTMADDPLFGSDYYANVLNNVVSNEENVKQVVAKVQLGEADAGMVYRTDVTPANRDQLQQIEVPAAYNIQAEYPMAVLSAAAEPGLAAEFSDFILSDEGQKILASWGFLGASGDCSPVRPDG